MGFADKCSLNIPFPSWASDRGNPSEDHENWKELQRWSDRLLRECLPSGGGGGVPTLFVASAYATDRSKSYADYVCDGTDDHVEINAAIASIAPPAWGGRVLLSEGDFYTTAPITVASGVTLVGFGEATYVDTSTSPVGVDLDEYATVENLTLAGWNEPGSYGVQMDAGIGATRFQTVRNCVIAYYDYGVYANAVSDMRVLDCRFEAHGAWSIYIEYTNDPHGAVIRGNLFRTPSHGITVAAGGAQRLVVADNVFSLAAGDIAVQLRGEDIAVTGNTITAETTTKSAALAAVQLSGTPVRVTFAGNAIAVQNGVAMDLTGAGASDLVVSGNSIWGHLRVAADRCLVTGNLFQPDATYPPTIEVTAASTDSCFASNFLPGGLASFTDAGVTTQRVANGNFSQGGLW